MMPPPFASDSARLFPVPYLLHPLDHVGLCEDAALLQEFHNRGQLEGIAEGKLLHGDADLLICRDYLKLRRRTTSLVVEPRDRANCLPSWDHA